MGASDKAALSRTRIAYLILGTFALLFLGLIYSWSIFSTPINASFGYGRSALDLVFSIAMACFCVGTVSSSYLGRRFASHNIIIASGVFMAAGFALTSLLGGGGIWVIYLCYGVLTGIACGLGYNSIITIVSLWFPERIGLASGVLLLGYGAGALLLGAPVGWVISIVGWQTTFLGLAVASLTVLGITAAILKYPPEHIVDIFPRTHAAKGNRVMAASEAHGTKYILTNVTFILFVCWRCTAMAGGITLLGDTEQGALQLGIPMDFALLMVGIVSVCNGASRIVFGTLFDRKGTAATMSIISVLALVSPFCLAAAFQTGSSTLYIIGALVIGFSYGGFPIMSTSFSMELFGRKDYPTAFAIANCAVIPASIISGLVISFVREPFGDVAVYAVFGVLALVGAIIALIVMRRYGKLMRNRKAALDAQDETSA